MRIFYFFISPFPPFFLVRGLRKGIRLLFLLSFPVFPDQSAICSEGRRKVNPPPSFFPFPSESSAIKVRRLTLPFSPPFFFFSLLHLFSCAARVVVLRFFLFSLSAGGH